MHTHNCIRRDVAGVESKFGKFGCATVEDQNLNLGDIQIRMAEAKAVQAAPLGKRLEWSSFRLSAGKASIPVWN